MKLDALTIVEDSDYFDRLGMQINLPQGLAASLAKLHGAPPPAVPTGKEINLPPVADSPALAEAVLPRSLTELPRKYSTMSLPVRE